jgi:hypothetical protein
MKPSAKMTKRLEKGDFSKIRTLRAYWEYGSPIIMTGSHRQTAST